MKIDMHCHVKEGSIDSKVSLDEYITKLKEHGFDGMLITDHDTYKGYRLSLIHISQTTCKIGQRYSGRSGSNCSHHGSACRNTHFSAQIFSGSVRRDVLINGYKVKEEKEVWKD